MQKREDERNILFIYELGHIDAYGRFLDENPTVREEGHLLIALGPELEYALAKKRIQFSSGRECVSFDAGRFLSASKEWTEQFDSPERQWFQYRGIALSQLFFFTIQHYTAHLLHYAALFENLLVRYPTVHQLIVFPSLQSPTLSSQDAALVRQQPLLRQYLDAAVACAQRIGAQRGIAVVIPHVPPRAKRVRLARFLFVLKRILLETGIHFYNSCIILFLISRT